MMLSDFATNFTAQFVALDIIGAIPIYFSLTHRMPVAERKIMVNKSMLVAFLVAVVFMLIGRQIFHFMGIEIFDFKMAGGIVLLLIALAELVGVPEAEKNSSGSTGIVPIAVPIISGPGVLTTIILQASTSGYLLTTMALILNYSIAWFVLRNSNKIQKVMGKDGTLIVSKIGCLLLTAYALSMIRTGVFETIHFWKGH
ncbi:MAG: MarC family protein [Bacteriovoracaceae bacterium]|nr:MarC family protein [Bacteriovoracaceae bacterium]